MVLQKTRVSIASSEEGEGWTELLSLAQGEGVCLKGQPEGAHLPVKLAEGE